MNTRLFQMLRKKIWVIDRILLVLFLEACDYNVRLEIEESTDTTSKKSDKEESPYFYDMPPLEGNDEK